MDIERLREIWSAIVNPTAAHWGKDPFPDWSLELEAAIAKQAETCTAEQVCLWAYFCYDLDFLSNSAYAVGYEYHPAHQLFGHSKLAIARRRHIWNQYRILLVFYKNKLGWKLRRNWQKKLDFLKAIYLDGADWHRLEMPWLEGKPRPDSAVLGGDTSDREQTPGPYDAVLGGQEEK